ncbi:MAG: phosphogluconate dehydrogenase C-terminal domain-containing protein [Cyclobacteriaceae bacterium]|nr:phosphogluconate dehydrogenase C-terminal domain-containing protein [Cyclobacteriaceae bacterium]
MMSPVYISHPAHPSVFNWEPTEEAQRDFFGGIKAKQVTVSAIMHGTDADYAIGDELTKKMYSPVIKNYRITVEQMGLLEPALVETLCSTLQVIVREALDIVIERRSCRSSQRISTRPSQHPACCNL